MFMTCSLLSTSNYYCEECLHYVGQFLCQLIASKLFTPVYIQEYTLPVIGQNSVTRQVTRYGFELVNVFMTYLQLGITRDCNAAQITLTHTSFLSLLQPPLDVARLQSSDKGYASRTALPNSRLNSPDSCYYISRITVTERIVFTIKVFTALLDNVFQQRKFHYSQAHILVGWRLPTPHWMTSISQLTRRCYATAYNKGVSSAFHASARDGCLRLGLSWFACLRARFLLASGRTQH
jgi:hypothetical protein